MSIPNVLTPADLTEFQVNKIKTDILSKVFDKLQDLDTVEALETVGLCPDEVANEAIEKRLNSMSIAQLLEML